MLTLTYRQDDDWHPHDVSELLKRIRQWMFRRGAACHYVWVLELTKRGRPHYHVLVWLPVGLTLPKPDKQGWWPKGMTRIEWARSPVGYIAKYASKTQAEARFPKGARLYGAGGLDTAARQHRRWVLLPAWIRDLVVPASDVRPAPGGGFVSHATGEWWASPWRFAIDPGGRFYVWRMDEPAPVGSVAAADSLPTSRAEPFGRSAPAAAARASGLGTGQRAGANGGERSGP